VYANSSSHGYYTLAIASQTATAFSLTAAPGGVQASDACGTFSYNQTGTKGVSGGTLTAADCW
jgi:type IV pilus assembly protein PilE